MQIDESNKPFSDSLGMGMAGVQKEAAFFASLGGITPWKLGMHQCWKQLSQWRETACLQSKNTCSLHGGPVRFLPGILLAADILGLHVTLLGKSYRAGVGRYLGHVQDRHCQGCVPIGHRELGGWQWLAAWGRPLGNRTFRRGASSVVELVLPLGCPCCPKSHRRIMGPVRMEPVSQPARYCQLGWEDLTRLDPQMGFPGWDSSSFLSFF